jgi:soluble lytic murein transglycosylase-like protein
MSFILVLASALLSTLFDSTTERAFVLAQNNEWAGAASALDQAYADDPVLFAANNFHYLRGRAAENQRDWPRALEEFKQIGPENPLYILAAWHAAKASAELRDDAGAEAFLKLLPRDFPGALKLQIARESSPALALKIYKEIPDRDARFERAKLLDDSGAFWALIRERKDDDVAFSCARLVAGAAATPRDQMDLAGVFAAHRAFDEALPMYQRVAENPAYAAEARYQIARMHFLREKYALALEAYQSIAKDFPETNWQKDSEYQIAACFWRLGDYRGSEKAYLDYINKYQGQGMDEGATRNLADVYRVLGENQKALTLLDRTLSKRLSVANRQVILFTKAKILYTQKRYTAALQIFQQLVNTKLRSSPGGSTAEEVQYFQALCLSKSGKTANAETIWRKLGRDPLSYYGQRAAEKLGEKTVKDTPPVCSPARDMALQRIETDLEDLRHPVRSALDPAADAVSELAFLRLWDEAAIWMERPGNRLNTLPAAEIAYRAGRFYRSIAYANRLPKAEAARPALFYPAGFRNIVCDVARMYKVDPLWLHAIIWQESRYNPNARSGAAARGLMQLIPQTASALQAASGVSELSPDKLYDPAVNIQMGAQLWSSLIEKLKYPEMALAAYNGGLDNVERWRNKWADASDDLELFVADIGFVETKRYVMAAFGAYAAYESLVNQ